MNLTLDKFKSVNGLISIVEPHPNRLTFYIRKWSNMLIWSVKTGVRYIGNELMWDESYNSTTSGIKSLVIFMIFLCKLNGGLDSRLHD